MVRKSARAAQEEATLLRAAVGSFHIFRRGLGLAPSTPDLDRHIPDSFEKWYLRR